jgi:YbbR domain-containing protein
MRFGLVILAVVALTMVGRDAEAQARGSLQATATVVDTRQGFEALSVVQQSLTSSKIERRSTVATVAQISTARPSTQPSAVVVTIDYSRN